MFLRVSACLNDWTRGLQGPTGGSVSLSLSPTFLFYFASTGILANSLLTRPLFDWSCFFSYSRLDAFVILTKMGGEKHSEKKKLWNKKNNLRTRVSRTANSCLNTNCHVIVFKAQGCGDSSGIITAQASANWVVKGKGKHCVEEKKNILFF